MANYPPSLIYDRIEQADHLSELQKAQLQAFAEEHWAGLPSRATPAELLGATRAFWSLIAATTETTTETSVPELADSARKRIEELEERFGEQFLGFRTEREYVALESLVPPNGVETRFPKRLARELHVVPYEIESRSMHVATDRPEDRELWLKIQRSTGLRPILKFAPKDEVKRALSRWYPSAMETPEEVFELALDFDPVAEEENQFDVDFARMHPTETLCSLMIGKMLASGFEDLMVEPEGEQTMVRVFDGTWSLQEALPRNLWEPVQLWFRLRAAQPLIWDDRTAEVEWPFMGQPAPLTFTWTTLPTHRFLGVSLHLGQAEEANG